MASAAFRTVYSPKDDKSGLAFDGARDMARQEFREECDINHIMKRYSKTGVAPTAVGVARYGDFSEVGDYLSAQTVVLTAREQFEALPAVVRDRFGGDPVKFLQFVGDKKNLDEAKKLGLLKDEVVEPIVKVLVTNAVPPAPEVK